MVTSSPQPMLVDCDNSIIRIDNLIHNNFDLNCELKKVKDSSVGDCDLIVNTMNNLIDTILKDVKQQEVKKWSSFLPEIKIIMARIIGKKDEKKDELIGMIKELKEDVRQLKESGPIISPPSKVSFAEMVKKKPSQHSFFIKPNDNETIEETGARLTADISGMKDLQINDIVKVNDSIKVITTHTNLIQKLNTNNGNNEYKIEREKKRDPLIKVTISKEAFEEIEVTKTRNYLMETDRVSILFKHEFKSKKGKDLYRVVYRISPEVLIKLSNSGLMFFNGEAAKYRIFYNIKICTNCWKHGHKKKDCNIEPQVNEPTDNCCRLCKNHNEKFDHQPLGINCITLSKLIAKERKRTAFKPDDQIN